MKIFNIIIIFFIILLFDCSVQEIPKNISVLDDIVVIIENKTSETLYSEDFVLYSISYSEDEKVYNLYYGFDMDILIDVPGFILRGLFTSDIEIKPNSSMQIKINDNFSIDNKGGCPSFEDIDIEIPENSIYENDEIKFSMYYTKEPFSIDCYNNYVEYMTKNGYPLIGYTENGKIYFTIH